MSREGWYRVGEREVEKGREGERVGGERGRNKDCVKGWRYWLAARITISWLAWQGVNSENLENSSHAHTFSIPSSWWSLWPDSHAAKRKRSTLMCSTCPLRELLLPGDIFLSPDFGGGRKGSSNSVQWIEPRDYCKHPGLPPDILLWWS